MMQPGALVNNRYRIEHVVGTGGMGTVYAAHDLRLGRKVAVKLLREDLTGDSKMRDRFLSEAQIAARVVHPNIVRTYDVGIDGDRLYLVQELLQGQSLEQAIPLAVDRALAIADDIAAGLQLLHAQGYVHCDIKPQNLWLRPNDEAVLLDFGIARLAGTATSTLIATPHYLAPERTEGMPPTPASDLYSLGIVLFQMLSGHVPFEGTDMHAILQAHRATPVPPLRIAEGAAPALDAIIAHLTAKAPEDRYPSAQVLREDLVALRLGRLVVAVHAARTQVVRASPSSRPAGVAGGGRPRAHWPARLRPYLFAAVASLALLLLFALAQARGDEPAGKAAPTPQGIIAVETVSTLPRLVPNVVGQDQAVAAGVLNDQGLQIEVAAVEANAQPAGAILRQEPVANAPVPADARIRVTVSGGPATPTSIAAEPTPVPQQPEVAQPPAPVPQQPEVAQPPNDNNGGQSDDPGKGNKDKEDKGKDDKEDKGKEDKGKDD